MSARVTTMTRARVYINIVETKGVSYNYLLPNCVCLHASRELRERRWVAGKRIDVKWHIHT